jgi:hypothetical protein
MIYFAEKAQGPVDLLSLNVANSCLMSSTTADFYSDRDFDLIWGGLAREFLQLDFDYDPDFVLNDLAVAAFFTGSPARPGFEGVTFEQVAEAYRREILVDHLGLNLQPTRGFLGHLIT